MQSKGFPYGFKNSRILSYVAGIDQKDLAIKQWEWLFSKVHQVWTNHSQVTLGFLVLLFAVIASKSHFFQHSNLQKRWSISLATSKRNHGVCPIFSQQQLEHFHMFQTKKTLDLFQNISTSTAGCWTWKVAKVSSSSLDAGFSSRKPTNRDGGKEKKMEIWNNPTGENRRLIVVGGPDPHTLWQKMGFSLGNEKTKTQSRWGTCITS